MEERKKNLRFRGIFPKQKKETQLSDYWNGIAEFVERKGTSEMVPKEGGPEKGQLCPKWGGAAGRAVAQGPRSALRAAFPGR